MQLLLCIKWHAEFHLDGHRQAVMNGENQNGNICLHQESNQRPFVFRTAPLWA